MRYRHRGTVFCVPLSQYKDDAERGYQFSLLQLELDDRGHLSGNVGRALVSQLASEILENKAITWRDATSDEANAAIPRETINGSGAESEESVTIRRPKSDGRRWFYPWMESTS